MATSRREAGSLATVIGGSGFVGRYVVRALARDGWRVRAAVRRPDLAGFLQPMGGVGQIHPVQCNVRYPASIAAALDGADVAINLVGLLYKSGAQTFDAVHVDGARAMARAARTAGVKRLIHVSAIGADAASKGSYGRTKAAGEAAVLSEFPDAIILRPSIVFGPEDNFFNRFANLARMAPVMPLVGGKTKFQPVYVGDLAQAMLAATNGIAKPATVYEIGGPEIDTFRGLLEKTQSWAGRSKPYFPMPFWLAKTAAFGSVLLPNHLRPLTVDQVRMLQTDNVVSAAATSEGRTLSALGVTAPHTMASVVPSYLERYQPKGQYAHYRG
jgi:uncharacterized protein YbjT (DUF2867 family)